MSAPLRIAIYYNLPSGGARRALYNHVTGLKERGYILKAWRPELLDKQFIQVGSLVEEQEVDLPIQPEGTGYVSRITSHVTRLHKLMKDEPIHTETCARQMREQGFDFLFANTDRLFASPSIGRFFHGKKALYLQEPNRHLYESMPELPWIALGPEDYKKMGFTGIKHRTRKRLEQTAWKKQARFELENARSYDNILVNSFYSRESVLRAYGISSDVCYLGVDTDKFHDQGKEREPFVIGLGTIGPTKNVKLAIEAIGTIQTKRPPLVWVGNMSDDVYVDQMKQLATKLGVDFQIRKMVTDEELIDLLNRATCMLYAPRLEPFGFAPLEANACGCTVVGVAEGGVREN